MPCILNRRQLPLNVIKEKEEDMGFVNQTNARGACGMVVSPRPYQEKTSPVPGLSAGMPNVKRSDFNAISDRTRRRVLKTYEEHHGIKISDAYVRRNKECLPRYLPTYTPYGIRSHHNDFLKHRRREFGHAYEYKYALPTISSLLKAKDVRYVQKLNLSKPKIKALSALTTPRVENPVDNEDRNTIGIPVSPRNKNNYGLLTPLSCGGGCSRKPSNNPTPVPGTPQKMNSPRPSDSSKVEAPAISLPIPMKSAQCSANVTPRPLSAKEQRIASSPRPNNKDELKHKASVIIKASENSTVYVLPASNCASNSASNFVSNLNGFNSLPFFPQSSPPAIMNPQPTIMVMAQPPPPPPPPPPQAFTQVAYPQTLFIPTQTAKKSNDVPEIAVSLPPHPDLSANQPTVAKTDNTRYTPDNADVVQRGISAPVPGLAGHVQCSGFPFLPCQHVATPTYGNPNVLGYKTGSGVIGTPEYPKTNYHRVEYIGIPSKPPRPLQRGPIYWAAPPVYLFPMQTTAGYATG